MNIFDDFVQSPIILSKVQIKDQVEKGRILIPAKERLEIDWDMANRLVKENKGFESFILDFGQNHQKYSLISYSTVRLKVIIYRLINT